MISDKKYYYSASRNNSAWNQFTTRRIRPHSFIHMIYSEYSFLSSSRRSSIDPGSSSPIVHVHGYFRYGRSNFLLYLCVFAIYANNIQWIICFLWKRSARALRIFLLKYRKSRHVRVIRSWLMKDNREYISYLWRIVVFITFDFFKNNIYLISHECSTFGVDTFGGRLLFIFLNGI